MLYKQCKRSIASCFMEYMHKRTILFSQGNFNCLVFLSMGVSNDSVQKSILHSSNFCVYTSHKSLLQINKEKIINSEYRSKLTIHQKHYLKSSQKQQKWILLNMLKVLSVTPKSSTIIIPHIFIKELLYRYCGVR